MSSTQKAETQSTDDFDDNTQTKENAARKFLLAVPLGQDPYQVALRLIDFGVKPKDAPTLMKQAWGNRHTPPLDPEQLSFACSTAYIKKYETSVLDHLAAQHGPKPEPVDVHRLAKALTDSGQLRRALRGDEDDAEETAAKAIEPTPYEWTDLTKIPRREYILKPAYIPGYVSLTVAAGGTGKTKLMMAEACSIASGKALLGVTPEKRARVWYWNGEDPQEEIDRNVGAIRLRHKLKPEDLEGWLFTDSGRDTPIKVALTRRGAFTIAVPVVESLIEAIEKSNIDVFIVDPFVTTHTADENDNPQMNAVVDLWRNIADKTGCSIHLVHHTRKANGEQASIESARGASALKDAARVRRTINQMTKAQAKAAIISEEDRRRYISADYGQSSLIPATGALAWYRFESVLLPNGDEDGGDGDDMGVVIAVDVAFTLSADDTEIALEAVRDGGVNRWRKGAQAGENWIGRPIGEALGLDPDDKTQRAQITKTIGEWLKDGLLREVPGTDQHRNPVTFIAADDPNDFG